MRLHALALPILALAPPGACADAPRDVAAVVAPIRAKHDLPAMAGAIVAGGGLEAIWALIQDHRAHAKAAGTKQVSRSRRAGRVRSAAGPRIPSRARLPAGRGDRDAAHGCRTRGGGP